MASRISVVIHNDSEEYDHQDERDEAKDPSQYNNDDDLPTSPIPGGEDPWTLLLESMTKYDGERIAHWKDDLANLLVFAGLLSSVLTAFVIESYAWLQMSNDDASVQLLAQISKQLASFSITPGFVNSTSPAMPLETLSPPSGPSIIERRINILWFLSLAMSLTASLFAIMAQQWLREYRLPGHLLPRDAIRLRQFRYRNLEGWGVPHILGILPIMLQIALIFFLVGLSMLLFTLDDLVAKVFISFVGVALAAYAAFTILPIASRHCPYKNPVAFGISIVIRYIGMVLVILLGVAMIAGLYAVTYLWMAYSRVTHRNVSAKLNALYGSASRFMNTTLSRATDGSRAMSGSQFWPFRELKQIPKVQHLDRDALTWAPTAMPITALPRLTSCLQELSPDDKLHCVIMWTSQALQVDHISMTDAVLEGTSPFTPLVVARIDESFSHRFCDLLLDVAPPNLITSSLGPAVLVMLRHVARTALADRRFVQSYSVKVLDTCRQMYTREGLAGDLRSYKRLPIDCLFECTALLCHELSDTELSSVFDMIDEIAAALFPLSPGGVTWVACIDTMMASTASVLYTVAARTDILRDRQLAGRLTENLKVLESFISSGSVRLAQIGTIPVDHFGDGAFLVLVPATMSVCQSLCVLAETRHLSSETKSLVLSVLHGLANALRGQPAFVEAIVDLDRLLESHRAGQSGVLTEDKEI